METKDILPILISSVTFLTSLVFFWLTAKQTKKNNSIPALIDYLREWRKEGGVIESYYFIVNNFSEDDVANESQLTLSTIKDEIRKKHAKNVSHYFDNLGLLVYSGAIEEKYLVSFVGVNAQKSWDILKNFIIAQRRLNKDEPFGDRHYQRHFEYFALLHRKGISALNRELDELVKNECLEI